MSRSSNESKVSNESRIVARNTIWQAVSHFKTAYAEDQGISIDKISLKAFNQKKLEPFTESLALAIQGSESWGANKELFREDTFATAFYKSLGREIASNHIKKSSGFFSTLSVDPLDGTIGAKIEAAFVVAKEKQSREDKEVDAIVRQATIDSLPRTPSPRLDETDAEMADLRRRLAALNGSDKSSRSQSPSH